MNLGAGQGKLPTRYPKANVLHVHHLYVIGPEWETLLERLSSALFAGIYDGMNFTKIDDHFISNGRRGP